MKAALFLILTFAFLILPFAFAADTIKPRSTYSLRVRQTDGRDRLGSYVQGFAERRAHAALFDARGDAGRARLEGHGRGRGRPRPRRAGLRPARAHQGGRRRRDERGPDQVHADRWHSQTPT